jgi:hypothetical protein
MRMLSRSPSFSSLFTLRHLFQPRGADSLCPCQTAPCSNPSYHRHSSFVPVSCRHQMRGHHTVGRSIKKVSALDALCVVDAQTLRFGVRGGRTNTKIWSWVVCQEIVREIWRLHSITVDTPAPRGGGVFLQRHNKIRDKHIIKSMTHTFDLHQGQPSSG